jgi:hypothetical protein
MLRVVREKGQPPRLFVGNKPVQALSDLFRYSQWKGGAWNQSLGRVPGALPSSVARTLAGISSRGIEVPLASIPGLMALPADRAPHPAQPPLNAEMTEFY